MSSPELHVTRQGSGRPLVMLHGWAMHGGLFRDIADALAEEAEIWRVDLPGHGLSHVEHLAQAEELLSALLPENCVLLGWSLGGQVALRLAHELGPRVGTLILLSSTPRFVNAPDWADGVEDAVLEQFGADLLRDPVATLQRFLALQVRGAADMRPALTRLRAELTARPAARAEALAEGLARLRDTDLRSLVPQITQPALVLHGAADRLTPVTAARWLAAHLPQARLEEIEQAAHAPFLSHTAQTLAALRAFLAEAA